MATLIESFVLSKDLDDFWAVDYRVRRDDGEEVLVSVTCTRTAEQTVRLQGIDQLSAARRRRNGSLSRV